MEGFRDPRLLEQWRDSGRYPAIHDSIFAAAVTHLQSRRLLDLCCAVGLLGTRLLRDLPADHVIGVEGNPREVALGRQFQIPIPVQCFHIGPDTVGRLGSLIKSQGITGVVARRCLSEVLAPDPAWGADFAEALAAVGVKEILLQGRVWSRSSTHPVPHTQAELDALGVDAGGPFTLRARTGVNGSGRDTAYLVLR